MEYSVLNIQLVHHQYRSYDYVEIASIVFSTSRAMTVLIRHVIRIAYNFYCNDPQIALLHRRNSDNVRADLCWSVSVLDPALQAINHCMANHKHLTRKSGFDQTAICLSSNKYISPR